MSTFPGSRLLIRYEVPIPIRETATRGDGPVTATAAANVPITISPTPTNASSRLTGIAPEPPESRTEREARMGPRSDKAIIPQQSTTGNSKAESGVCSFDGGLDRPTPEGNAPDGEFGSRPSLPTGPPWGYSTGKARPYRFAFARGPLVPGIDVHVKSVRLHVSSEVRVGEGVGARPSGSFGLHGGLTFRE